MKKHVFEIPEEEAQKIRERWAEEVHKKWASESRGKEYCQGAFNTTRETSIFEIGPIFVLIIVLMFAWSSVNDIFPMDYIQSNLLYFFIWNLLLIGISVLVWLGAVEREESAAEPEEPAQPPAGNSLLFSICLNLLFACFAIYSLSITCCQAEPYETIHYFLGQYPILEFENVFWYIGIATVLGIAGFIALSMQGRYEAPQIAKTLQNLLWFYNIMLFSLQFLAGSQTYLAPYFVFLLFLSLIATISITLTEIAYAPQSRKAGTKIYSTRK